MYNTDTKFSNNPEMKKMNISSNWCDQENLSPPQLANDFFENSNFAF